MNKSSCPFSLRFRGVSAAGALGTALTVLSAVSSVQAVVVNVDFGLTGNHPLGITSAPFTGTGAAPDSGTFWNQVIVTDNNAAHVDAGEFGFWTDSVTVSNLTDSTGSATPLGITAFATADTGAFAVLEGSTNLGAVARDAVNLMRDYLIGFNAPQSVELNGFAPFTVVDLYLYGAGDTDNRDTVFSITDSNGLHSATTTGTLTGNPASPVAHNLTAGADYAVLSGIVADATGKITIFYDNGAGSGEAPFNGLQAVYVPEPSSTLLLLLGGALLPLADRRRSRRTGMGA